jgi:hypothetical protein
MSEGKIESMIPILAAKIEPKCQIAPMSPPSRNPRDAAIQSHDRRSWVCCRAWLPGRPPAATATGLRPVRGNLGAVAGKALREPIQPLVVEILAGLRAASRDKRTLASRPSHDASEPSWFLMMNARGNRQRQRNRPVVAASAPSSRVEITLG